MFQFAVPVYLMAEETADKMAKIWETLDVSDVEKETVLQKLIDKIKGLCNEAIEEETTKIRFNSLCEKVVHVREQIAALWEEAFIKSDIQKQKLFSSYFDPQDRITDVSLTAHEDYLEKFLKYMQVLRPLLAKVARREAVVDERMEYENILQNPDRLKSRGYTIEERVKEEAMCARVRKLDKTTTDLLEEIQNWEKENGIFVYLGVRYTDRVKKQNREYFEYHDQLRLARRRKNLSGNYDEEIDGARTPRAVSPKGSRADTPEPERFRSPRALSPKGSRSCTPEPERFPLDDAENRATSPTHQRTMSRASSISSSATSGISMMSGISSISNVSDCVKKSPMLPRKLPTKKTPAKAVPQLTIMEEEGIHNAMGNLTIMQ